MTDQPDRIRVWNEETGEMMEPVTIRELLYAELGLIDDPYDIHASYDHLVFMRNIGVYADPSKMLAHSSREEIFADDLVTHSTEKWLYRVTQKRGCWWAMSFRTDMVPARLLNSVIHPHIVGNVFENRDLVLKGEIDDET